MAYDFFDIFDEEEEEEKRRSHFPELELKQEEEEFEIEPKRESHFPELLPEDKPLEIKPRQQLQRKSHFPEIQPLIEQPTEPPTQPEPQPIREVKQPTEEEIESYRNSSFIKEFFSGVARDIKNIIPVLGARAAEGFTESMVGKLGKGSVSETIMDPRGLYGPPEQEKEREEAVWQRLQEEKSLREKGYSGSDITQILKDKSPFAELAEKHEAEMNPYAAALVRGGGALAGELPSFLFVLGAIDKLGKLYNWGPKITQIVGMATHGALGGLSDADIEAVARKGVSGGMMGSIGGLVSKLKKPLYQIMAEGFGFATVGALEDAIEAGEIPNVWEKLKDPETFARYGMGALVAARRMHKGTIGEKRVAAQKQATKDIRSSAEVIDDYIGDIKVSDFEHRMRSILTQEDISRIVGEKAYSSRSKLNDAAINFYREIPEARVDPREAVKNFKGFDKAAAERALQIKEGDPLFEVAELLKAEYKSAGEKALAEDVIYNLREHYGNRVWDMTDQKTKRYLGGRFALTSKHAKERIIPSIWDGLGMGLKLKVKTATDSLRAYQNDINTVIASKKMMDAGLATEIEPGRPMFSTEKLLGYNEIKNPWFKKTQTIPRENKLGGIDRIITERNIYAPEILAKQINNILGTEFQHKVFDTVAKVVAVSKAVTLSSSLFHHQAFGRSFMGGVSGKAAMHPRAGYKEGLEAMRSLDPEIMELVRNGLTLGVQQEWPELKMKAGSVRDRLSSAFRKIPGVRVLGPGFLFEKLGAGLKAKAALVELNRLRLENVKRIRAGKDPVPERKLYEWAAEFANADFGGLNLDRYARNKTLQKWIRIGMLAPDWTESNIRTMTKMVRTKGAAEKRGAWTSAHEMEAQIYRRFWGNVLGRGAAASLAVNAILASLSNDPDDTLKNIYKDALESKNLKAIFGIDLTPIIKMAGIRRDKKLHFNTLGHFLDPIKWVHDTILWDMLSMPKAKGSHFTRGTMNLISGRNWKGMSFKDITKIIEDGVSEGYLEWGSDGRLMLRPEQVPAYLIEQARSTLPIQLQQLLNYYAGESDAVKAIFKSLGFDVVEGVEY
jgi:hypothetical protein